MLLVGGGAASEAVRKVAPQVFGRPVDVPPAGEYAALGAARQAAWVLSGEDAPPDWSRSGDRRYEADPVPAIRARYAEARDSTLRRLS